VQQVQDRQGGFAVVGGGQGHGRLYVFVHGVAAHREGINAGSLQAVKGKQEQAGE
jgi:hypothetical protein